MRILLLAPHPFYQERGTPIAVDMLVRVLSEAGHAIDILTFHEGADRKYDGAVRILRIAAPAWTRGIRPGFSFKKLACDRILMREALRLATENKYDLIHAVEESAYIARVIKRKTRTPYVYDMDSSLPSQMAEKFPLLRLFMPVMRGFECGWVRDACAVIVMCDSLADAARRHGAEEVAVLRDVSLLPVNPPGATPPTAVATPAVAGLAETGLFPESSVLGPGELLSDKPTQAKAGGRRAFRKELGIKGPCFMYVGNLERYQGIDLLLESFAICGAPEDTRLVVAGGTDSTIRKYRAKARALGIDKTALFTGPIPLEQMPSLFEAADVLVSPRISGVNTPMKIYSYLASGKAVLATDIPSHTQVLTPEVAMLVPPRVADFAAGLKTLAGDPALRGKLGRKAAALAAGKHSFEAFKTALLEIYSRIEKNK